MTDLEMELRFERIESHLLRLTDAMTDFINGSDARMMRLELILERLAQTTDRLQQNMARLQQNVEQTDRTVAALIRAIIADRSNGKGGK